MYRTDEVCRARRSAQVEIWRVRVIDPKQSGESGVEYKKKKNVNKSIELLILLVFKLKNPNI